MRLILVAILAAGMFNGCSYLNRKVGMADDHAAEEFLEKVIEEHTGVDVDLTPSTQEDE